MIVKKKIYVTPEVTFELMEGEDLLTFSHTAGDHTTEHSNPGDDAPGTIPGGNVDDGVTEIEMSAGDRDGENAHA